TSSSARGTDGRSTATATPTSATSSGASTRRAGSRPSRSGKTPGPCACRRAERRFGTVPVPMTAVYPPDKHLLRDLRFTFEHDVDGARSRAWMPVVDELCTDLGQARAGALATLVDVIGGGVAANAAAPGWI